MSLFLFSLASILSFLFVFTIIVFVHEMGHFLAARWLGFKVETFSIGFGKPLVQWQDKHGTLWRISRLPLGGFVKFAGDSDAASTPDVEQMEKLKELAKTNPEENPLNGIFPFMPLWRRAVVVVSGPLMNFAFAIVVFSIFLMIFGTSYTGTTIGSVRAESPAAIAGFQVGDKIINANGEPLESFQRLATIVSISADDPIQFTVDRAGQQIALTATPETVIDRDPFGRMSKKGLLGIGGNAEVFTKRYGPIAAIGEGSVMTKKAIGDQIAFVGRLFRGKGSAEMLGGPLRILYIAGKVGAGDLDTAEPVKRSLSQRVLSLIWLAGGLSVAIGLINLAPVPMLDGGHLVFYAYEAIVGRPLSEQLQIIGFKLGFSAVICLLAFATFNDLRYFDVFDFIGRLFS